MSNIRLIISDLDGTLMARDEVMAPCLKDLAKSLEKRGILFTVATGRSYAMCQRFVTYLGVRLPVSVSNGAAIVETGRLVEEASFAWDSSVRLLAETADRYDMAVVFSAWGRPDWALRRIPWVLRQQSRYGIYLRDYPTHVQPEPLHLQKLMIYDPAHQLFRLRPLLAPSGELSCVLYETNALELGPPGRSKATGAAALARMLRVSMRETMVVGDNVNDIEMLRAAGIGVAVGNALTQVRDIADYVCKGETWQGVLEAIERFCP